MKVKLFALGVVIVGVFVAVVIWSIVFISKQSTPTRVAPVVEIAPVEDTLAENSVVEDSVRPSCPDEEFVSFCDVWDAEPIALSEQSVEFLDLKMNLPFGWSVQSVTGKEIRLKTAYKMYQTVLIIDYFDSNTSSSSHPDYRSDWRVYNKANALAIYEGACAPAFGCYIVEVQGNPYSINFSTVVSDQPVPVGLDGPWRPASDVTDEIIASMLKSVQKR